MKRLIFAFPLVATWLMAADPDYTAVDALFQKHCLDCHSAADAEGQLILDSYDLLMKGGETGPAVVPGKSAESILIKSVEGSFEKNGKRTIMPPGSKRKKLDSDEVALLKAWIDAGAKGPSQPRKPVELVTPKIPLKSEPRRSINALAFAPELKLLAVARYGEVELLGSSGLKSDARHRTNNAVVGGQPRRVGENDAPPSRTGPPGNLTGHRGNVNALVFSSSGSHLFAAAGEPGLFGEVRQWSVVDGKLVRLFEGHQDAIYSTALSPDGKILATGSYDQKIKMWNVATGQELSTLHGHNGAVFGLAFRPDGKILASVSADRTVKLWNVDSGKRTDTLSQPLKDQYTVVFSKDGKRLYAGGADSRIRIWQISETAVETTNPMLGAHFAHEGTILRLALSDDGRQLVSSADDRTVKLWDARDLKQQRVFDKQSDWVSAIAFAAESLVIGRMDGSLEVHEVRTTLKAEAK